MKKMCSNFRQLLIMGPFLALSAILCPKVHAQGLCLADLQLKPRKRVVVKARRSRLPTALTPTEETVVVPAEIVPWYANIFIEDDRGIMVGMRNRVQEWQTNEQYLEQWNLEGTGLLPEVPQKEKVRFLRRRGLKYLDKRVAGEIRSAEAGSAWHTVGQVRRALRPNTKVSLSKRVRLRMRAKVLQGQARFILENPYMDAYVDGRVNGQAEASLGKTLDWTQTQALTQYRLKENEWVSQINQPIGGGFSARGAHTTRFDAPLPEQRHESLVELNWSAPFY